MKDFLPGFTPILTKVFAAANRSIVNRRFRLLLIIFIISVFSSVELKSQDNSSDYDEISVLVQIDSYGSFYTSALYSNDGILYVSIEDLFDHLKIPCLATDKGDNLTGFLGSENRNYVISNKSLTVKVADKISGVKKGIIKQQGSLYLESSLFGPLLGINLNFNFRSLSIKVKADFELPAVKEQRLEKMRSNIRKSTDEIAADTILNRDYHLFRFGMADWAVSSSQIRGLKTENQYGLGLGAEVLGGDANLFLNYSDQYKLDKRLQQYLWRWVDNDNKVFSQVQLGKIDPQTISSLYYPIVGGVITNAKTSVRKAMGEYIIKEVTQPDWLVELYINNSLVDYTKADAAGLFMFKVPMVYGYTTLMLKFYGPMGEERSENKTINVPYSFLPSGEIEYRVTGGILEDDKKTPFGRGEATLGVTRFLTMGMGIEYMGSVTSKPAIPFVTASFMPMSRLMIFGEYDYGVRFKGLLNYYPGANSTLELDYTKYAKDQHAILYNYLEERKASFSIPLRVKNVSGFFRAEYKQNVYSNLNYNISELLFSGYYKQFNVNLSAYANWVSNKSAYMNSMIALSYRLRKGFSLRSSTQFSFSGEKFLSYKIEAEKRFVHNGYMSVTYENNTAVNNSSVNLNFKYDLAFAQTNASARVGRHEVSTFQNVRGSLLFGKGRKQIKTSELSNVGRGGLTIIPFIDVNHNGVFDKNEHKAANLKVLINGGRIIYSEKDSIITIIGLEPFISYNLQLDDKDFENLSWRIHDKSYKVMIDPDQLKIITVPVIPVGEVTGTINLDSDGHLSGIGRILVDFFTEKGVKVGQTLSESDGYFDYLGLEAGKYIARIDSLQLSRLDYTSEPKELAFSIKESDDGDIEENINFTLNEKVILKTDDTTSVKQVIPGDILNGVHEIRDSVKPLQKKNDYTQEISEKSTLIAMNQTDTVKTVSDSIGIKKANIKESSLQGNSIDSLKNESHFYVQIGAFRQLSKAEKLKAELQAQISYPEALVAEDGYFKIRIGYFSSNYEAEQYNVQLKKKGIISFVGQSLFFGYPGDKALGTGAYFVSAGSFRYKMNAMQYVQKMKEATPFDCGVIEEEGLFKVRFGYFNSKGEAAGCLQKLTALGIKGTAGESKTYIYSGTLFPVISDIQKK